MLHGTGAETPTQVTLFASAAAAGSSSEAALVMLAFVAGLVVSDLAVAVLWLGGRMGSLRLPRLQLAFGLFTGAGSLLVGLAFIGARGLRCQAYLEDETHMCTFRSDTEVMVWDLSRDQDRSVLSASLGRSVSFETVQGQGTRVRYMESERSAEFVALLETALEPYRSPAT